LSASPDKIYPQETTTFQYTLEIGALSGAATVQITSVEVKFDWESSPMVISSGTVVFVLPDSHTYSRTITVPQSLSLGQRSATIKVTGQAVGDWWATSQTWTDTFVVETRPPLDLAVSGNPSTGYSPLTVYFSSTVTGGTPPYSYSWTFGDGGSSASANPSHTYSSTGTFTATLTVHDALSRIKSDTFQVTATTSPNGNGGGNGGGGGGGVDIGAVVIGVIAVIVVVAVVAYAATRKKK
jgi:PKD repeat protein